MDNEVGIRVTSENDTAAGFKAALKEAEGFSKSTQDILKKAGKESAAALMPVARQVEAWNVRLTESRGVVEALRKKIAETGDVSLFGDLSRAEADFQRILKFRDALSKDLGDAGRKGGTNFLHGFTDAVGAGMSRGILTPQIVGAVAAAAPLISSVLAGAVTLGVGAGVVGAGIAASAQDPRVRGAAKELGNILKLNLSDIAADTFVPETLAALSFVKGQFRAIRPDLERIFADGAKLVEPLTRGLVGGIRGVLPGIEDAVHRAGPLFDVLEQQVPRIGRALGEVVSDFSKSAAESADTIAGILALTEATLLVAGKSLSFLSDNSALLGLGPLQALGDAISDNDGKTKEWADAFGGLKEAIEEAKEESMDYAETIKAQTDPTFAMIKAQKDLSEAQHEYNEALKDHGKNSPEARDALLALGQAAIEAQIAAQGLAGDFNGELTPSMRATLKAAGLTTDEIAALEKQFKDAKRAGDDYAKTYRAKIVTEYFGRPFSDFTGIGGSTARGLAHGGIASAATGGTRSGFVEVGEHGREIVKLPPGAHVMSNPDSERMLTGGGGGSFSLEIGIAPGASETLMTEIVNGLVFTLRNDAAVAAEVRGD